jgi:Carboxypeptidase regulatory-like domain/TonB-dependent Receptor Plug Domain
VKIWVLYVLLLIFAGASYGQTAAGTLTGVVTDATGAVVANVPVVATHVETGTRVTGVTSQTGNYTIAQMPVGRYVVTVTQTGFKTYRQENVIIAAAQALRLDVALEVGATSESVTVTAESTLLQTETGALVKNISPQQIQNLPVLPATAFIRDPLQLVQTLPGSVQGGPITGYSPRMNGLSNANNQIKIDGEPVANSGDKGTISTRNNVSPDAIQEVAIQSSNFNAEYGSASGVLFNLIIKSGTNQYHGTAYDYIGNDKFNADDAGSHTRNRVRRNDYGFNVGGPVWLPKIYNGKDKTFFFFNWEQYRDYNYFLAAINPVPTVPTPAYRTGDFTGLLSVPGVSGNLKINGHDYKDPFGNTIPLGTIFDPRSTKFNVPCNTALTQDCIAGTNLTVRSPFVGNRVPASMIDKVSATILSKYVPLPQGPNAAAGILTNNYLNGISAARITRSPAVKIDQNLGSKMRVGFTYNDNHTDSPIQTIAPGAFAEGFPEPITTNSGTFEASPTYRINFDYNIKPTMLFHLGVGWQEFNFCACPVTQQYDAASGIGLTFSNGAHLPLNSFPRMNATTVSSPQLGGLNNLSTGGPNRQLERYPSTSANLTWIHGNHTVKVGADARQNQQVQFAVANSAGNFSFGTSTATALTGNGITWQPSLNGLTGFTGFSGAVGFPFANWLMGSVTSLNLAVPSEYRKTKQQYGVYIQDTWKIRRNLTLDYGLRWDYGTYAHEDYGRVAGFSLNTPNPAADGRAGAYIYEASCNCNFAQNYPYAIGPRIGIAYSLNSKTVIRGGAGIAYGATPFTAGGISNNVTTPTLPNGFDDFTLQAGIPVSKYQPVVATSNPSAGFAPGTVNTNLATLVDPNGGRPDRTYQWNLSIQHEITRNLVVEAAYVGNRNIWGTLPPGSSFQDFNAVSPAMLQRYGFTIDGSAQGIADQKLLNTKFDQLSAAQKSVLAQRGITVPYGSFPTSGPFVQTVFQALKNFPQFSGGIVPSSAPQAKSWYDSLQLNGTKRFSHGLSANVAYTFSKNLQWAGAPDIFNPDVYTKDMGKDLVGANPPQILRISFEYRTPRYKGTLPVMSNRIVSYVLGDWTLSSALYYQTAGYLGRPQAGSANGINLWLGRGPGSAQLKKNADGSLMNPWSVDWTDFSGQHHTDPLDINCHCFDPNKTVVINPAAWDTIPDATWTADTSTYAFFRGQRRPAESMNFSRNFTFKERYTFQVRMEFQNVFNRIALPSPQLNFNPANVTNTYQKAPNGNYIAGFGTFGNLANGNQLGTPRSGQLIGRFTF